MGWTYNLATNVGKVRNLIDDTATDDTALFTDEEITSILTLEGNDIYGSAAVCMIRIAASKALLAKLKQAGNYKEDLRSIAKECRETAKSYREVSKNEPADAQAEVAVTPFNYREIERKKALRNEVD